MTGRRKVSRYANDKQIERAADLALRLGVKLKLGADGSVEINGRLDSPANDAAALKADGGDDADEEIRQCRETYARQRTATTPGG